MIKKKVKVKKRNNTMMGNYNSQIPKSVNNVDLELELGDMDTSTMSGLTNKSGMSGTSGMEGGHTSFTS